MTRVMVLFAAGALAVVGTVGFPGPSVAQPDRAARAVVDSFFAFVARERWDSAAALIDMKRFEPYFAQQVRNARSALPQRQLTVEEMMASDTTMPRAVAEWEVARTAKYAKLQPFGDLSSEFAGVTTQQALFALSVPDAAARWIEAQDERTQMRESFRRAGCSLPTMATFRYPATKRRVMGSTLADDSTALVVHTDNRFGGDPATLMGSERVMVLHRTGTRWRIEPRRDLLQMMNSSFGFGECPRPR